MWPETETWSQKMTLRTGWHIPGLTSGWLAGYFLQSRKRMMQGCQWCNGISMVMICSSTACLSALSQVRNRWKGRPAFIAPYHIGLLTLSAWVLYSQHEVLHANYSHTAFLKYKIHVGSLLVSVFWILRIKWTQICLIGSENTDADLLLHQLKRSILCAGLHVKPTPYHVTDIISNHSQVHF